MDEQSYDYQSEEEREEVYSSMAVFAWAVVCASAMILAVAGYFMARWL